MLVPSPHDLVSDKGFQVALQRYLLGNGSSDGVASALLRALQPAMTAHNRRINELLEANNRYLNEARDARADVRALEGELRILRNGLKVKH